MVTQHYVVCKMCGMEQSDEHRAHNPKGREGSNPTPASTFEKVARATFSKIFIQDRNSGQHRICAVYQQFSKETFIED